MRAIVQRVASASVRVDGNVIGRCGAGFLALVGVHRDDGEAQAIKLADRVAGMRVFADDTGKMNLALRDLPESEAPRVLAISNFTVYGDASQRRPSFVASASYEQGRALFDAFVASLRDLGVVTETGEFGAHMEVELVNDGPVTLVVDV